MAERIADATADVSGDAVLRIVRESYASLARSSRVSSHLLVLTERFATQRIRDARRDRDADVPHVLFVCVQNAGRSQLAAALVERRAAGRVVARSAGSMPAADVHPDVRALIDELGVDGDPFPKPLTDDAVRAADVVVTMGCGDVCPIIPGVRYEDWEVGDPALASPEGVRAIRDDIERRVDLLLAELDPDRPTRRPPMTDSPTALFVCVHNAGRSQMAAGFLRELSGGAVEVRSAGSMPAEQINPTAVDAMQEVGIDIRAEVPKVLTTDAVRESDVVITMGCGDACPIFPGKRYEDWELDDPAGQGIEAVRPIRDDIELRVRGLLDSLGIQPVR